MIINNNTAAFSVWTSYTFNNEKLSDAMSRLSTGVIKSTDDPAGIGVSERLRAQASGVNSARGNVDDGVAMMQTADSWLQKINDMLVRMQDLVIEAGGVTTDSEKNNLQIEFEEMQEEIIGITSRYNAAGKYNGLYLFRGGNGTTGAFDSIKGTGGISAAPINSQVLAVSSNASSKLIALADGGFVVGNSLIDGTSSGTQQYDNVGTAVGALSLSVADASTIVALGTGGFLSFTNGDVELYDLEGNDIGDTITVSSESIQSLAVMPNGDFAAVVGTGVNESVVFYDMDAASIDQLVPVTVSGSDTTATARIDVFNDGSFLIADGNSIYKYDDSAVVDSSFTAVSTSSDVESLAILNDASFIVQTGTGSSAEFQRYYSNGAIWGDAFSIDDDVQGIIALDDGGFAVLATDESDTKLNIHRYSSSNSLFEVFQVNSGRDAVSDSGISVLTNSNLAVEWGENGRSYFRIYSLEGGVSVQTGPDLNQRLSLELPDLQETNHEVVGDYTTYTYNTDGSVLGSTDTNVRWSDVLSSSTTVTSTGAEGVIGVAVEHVARARALVNAQQVQLEQRKEALLTYEDNLNAAESMIRDVDIARETTDFSKYEILTNASSAVLAQANTHPSSILRLLGS